MSEQLELFWDTPGPAEAGIVPAQPPPAASAEVAEYRLSNLIAARLKRPFSLTITQNRQTMMSLRPQRNGSVNVRLHHFFLDAPDAVLQAVADWVKHPRDKVAGQVVDAYIRAHAPKREAAPPAPTSLVTRGRVHDLMPFFTSVNEEHFSGKIDCGITWGRAPHRHRRRYMRLGSYAPHEHLIRIHPHLDEEFVPAFFVRYIVYHEMLHAHLGIGEMPDGRRSIHPPQFKRMEQAYPDFHRAEAWLKEPRNLSRVMGARRHDSR